jgi:hypothetical protein
VRLTEASGVIITLLTGAVHPATVPRGVGGGDFHFGRV